MVGSIRFQIVAMRLLDGGSWGNCRENASTGRALLLVTT